ncbi:MAG: histidine kinase [Bacteroidota bacterium]|nr:histidine kinase [Bacteroidota bacterium]
MKAIYITIIILIIYIFSPYKGFSQKYVIKNYSIEDGLPQTQVDDICQDSFGYIWIATRGGGLGKFDGKTFTTYKTKHGLPSNLITNILWSQDKKLWIGTYEGLSLYNGKDFKNLQLLPVNSRQTVTSLAEDADGNIWVANISGGISKISNDSILYYGAKDGFTDKVIKKIIFDPLEKKVWFCTIDDGVKYFHDGNFHKFSHPDLKKIPSVLTLNYDGDQLLFGTRAGLYKKKNSGNHIEKVTEIKNQPILEIKKDASGKLWLGTDNGIIMMYEDQVEVLDYKEGFSPVPVKKIFEDNEGLIWFSGDNLKNSSTMRFKKIDISDGLPQASVMNLNFDLDDNLWIGMIGGGISRFSNSHNEQTLKNYGFIESAFCSIVDNEGNPLFATNTGLYKYQEGNFIHYDLHKIHPNPVFESVFKDKEGSIWWGGLNNIVLYREGIFRKYNLPNEVGPTVVRSFGQLKSGKVLIGTNTGLYQFSNDTITKLSEPFFSDKSIMNILEDEQGMVWMGLYGDGLMRWNPKTNSIKIYTEEDGLTSNLIYCMIFDHLERLWLGSEKGIDVVRFDRNFNIKHVKNFGKPEGFYGIETNHNAITKDKKGNIWVGTVKGVYTFNPDNIQINTKPPQLTFTGIKLYHEVPDWNKYSQNIDNWNNIPTYIKVPYNKNHLTFNFQSINFQNSQKIYYSYKLLNFDEKWSPVSDSKEAVYANLPPGDYTFMVRSKNEDGIWNSNPVQYSFSITSPIWMRWWFYLFILVVFLVLSKIIYNYLVHRKLNRILTIEKIKTEEAEKIRNIVAKDFHDEMGNHLASISILVQLLKRKASPYSFELDQIVEKIDSSSRTLFNGTKNFIWSIDPKNDKLYEVLLYIKDFGEDLFDNTEINFYMDINHLNGKCLKLAPGFSRHIVLIIKEALTNCLKHARCKNVWIFVKLEGYSFKITIKDDGKGFCSETLKINSNNIGLENMKFRASKIKCKLGITPGENKGTELVLIGELPYFGL